MSDIFHEGSPAQPTFLLNHIHALSHTQCIFKVFASNASQTFACYTELLYYNHGQLQQITLLRSKIINRLLGVSRECLDAYPPLTHLRVKGKLQKVGRTSAVLASLLQGFFSNFELTNHNTAAQKKEKDRGLNPARWNMETAQENLPKRCVCACMCVHKPFIKLSSLLKSLHFEKLQIKCTFICQHQENLITIYIHKHISFIQLLLHTVSCKSNALFCF